jgi:protein TonB
MSKSIGVFFGTLFDFNSFLTLNFNLMNNKKKNSNGKNQLQPNSNLFLQLGILLALAIVYSVFELRISHEVFIPPQTANINAEPETFAFPDFEIEKKKPTVEVKKQTVPKKLTNFVINNNPDDPTEDDLFTPEPPSKINIDSLLSNLPKDDEETYEVIDFIRVEQAPRFPGCEGDNEEELKNCFNKKMNKFVAKNFNPNINSTFQGKQKVYVQFEINAEGNIVNIKARSPLRQLEKEAIEVIGELPKMIPAKQRNRNVSIRYNLPIVLHVE